jgi:hypothetical protein
VVGGELSLSGFLQSPSYLKSGLRQTCESSLSRLKMVFLHRHYTEGTTR